MFSEVYSTKNKVAKNFLKLEKVIDCLTEVTDGFPM